jgi:hypothetical protein
LGLYSHFSFFIYRLNNTLFFVFAILASALGLFIMLWFCHKEGEKTEGVGELK